MKLKYLLIAIMLISISLCPNVIATGNIYFEYFNIHTEYYVGSQIYQDVFSYPSNITFNNVNATLTNGYIRYVVAYIEINKSIPVTNIYNNCYINVTSPYGHSEFYSVTGMYLYPQSPTNISNQQMMCVWNLGSSLRLNESGNWTIGPRITFYPNWIQYIFMIFPLGFAMQNYTLGVNNYHYIPPIPTPAKFYNGWFASFGVIFILCSVFAPLIVVWKWRTNADDIADKFKLLVYGGLFIVCALTIGITLMTI